MGSAGRGPGGGGRRRLGPRAGVEGTAAATTTAYLAAAAAATATTTAPPPPPLPPLPCSRRGGRSRCAPGPRGAGAGGEDRVPGQAGGEGGLPGRPRREGGRQGGARARASLSARARAWARLEGGGGGRTGKDGEWVWGGGGELADRRACRPVPMPPRPLAASQSAVLRASPPGAPRRSQEARACRCVCGGVGGLGGARMLVWVAGAVGGRRRGRRWRRDGQTRTRTRKMTTTQIDRQTRTQTQT